MVVRDKKELSDVEQALQAEFVCETSLQEENNMALPKQEQHYCEGVNPNRVPQTNIPSPALPMPLNPYLIASTIVFALGLLFQELKNRNKKNKN